VTELLWKIGRRTLTLGRRTHVMGVLNVTPDSFSDGGLFFDAARAVARAEEMVEEGADILDVGGESTRPGGAPVSDEEELRRVVPVVEAVARKVGVPVSVDTTKAAVARAALDAGAEIVNDISGLRFDPSLADEAAREGAGLVLMHSRGGRETLHAQDYAEDIWEEVTGALGRSIAEAVRRGVRRGCIALDPGIGFGKSQRQNLELLARLNRLADAFPDFPLLVGTSRKSFLGRITGLTEASERTHATTASVAAAVLRGAHVVRVHDVRAAVEASRVADAIREVTSDEKGEV
jgi:dihydropteroate synthase